MDSHYEEGQTTSRQSKKIIMFAVKIKANSHRSVYGVPTAEAKQKIMLMRLNRITERR
jgi:hypothetical protein